jgi:hypothetical protein
MPEDVARLVKNWRYVAITTAIAVLLDVEIPKPLVTPQARAIAPAYMYLL